MSKQTLDNRVEVDFTAPEGNEGEFELEVPIMFFGSDLARIASLEGFDFSGPRKEMFNPFSRDDYNPEKAEEITNAYLESQGLEVVDMEVTPMSRDEPQIQEGANREINYLSATGIARKAPAFDEYRD